MFAVKSTSLIIKTNMNLVSLPVRSELPKASWVQKDKLLWLLLIDMSVLKALVWGSNLKVMCFFAAHHLHEVCAP